MRLPDIYGLNYAPERTGVGKFTGEMAEWLQGRGTRSGSYGAAILPRGEWERGIAVGATGGSRCMVLTCFVVRYGYPADPSASTGSSMYYLRRSAAFR